MVLRKLRRGDWFCEYGFDKKGFRITGVHGTKVNIIRADGTKSVIKKHRLTTTQYYKFLGK